MSGQHSQSTPARVVKSSPNPGKQGPLKATLPMASLLKHGSNLRTSPAVSPTSAWKANRASPDHSSGQRSPGSSAYKVKSKTLGSVGNNSGSAIRRTASLDTIYLKGHWPKDNYYLYSETLQVNKATQTEDTDWTDPRKITSISETKDDKLDKIRQRIRSNKESNTRLGTNIVSIDHTLNSSSQTFTSCILSPTLKANPVNIPLKPVSKSSMRSSVEGLNQEIERLVLKTGCGGSHYTDRSEDFTKFSQSTPEGHRAPLADLLRNTRSRSVNTQTPGVGDLTGSCHSSGDSIGSSPDQEGSNLGTSPHINKFLAREPPDGCERVNLKSLDEPKWIPMELAPQPCIKLKPSLGSAFQILQPNLSNEQDLPLVPQQQSQQDLI